MMEKLVLLSDSECSEISGGRSEQLAYFVEEAARFVGSAARFVYMIMNKGAKYAIMEVAIKCYAKC